MTATVTHRLQTGRLPARRLLEVYAGLWLLTAGALLATLLVPSIGTSRTPQPTLHPNVGAIAGIALNNARSLAPAFLLAAFQFGNTRASRTFGDVLVAAPLALVGVNVGVAFGRWGPRLLPYVPQLPIEYLAAATAATVWVAHRRPHASAPPLTRDAALVLALIGVAAAVEVLVTPHAR